MDVLGKLFSSAPLVRIMRLFLLNPDQPFDPKDISMRSKVSPAALRTELTLLRDIGFVKKTSFYKEIPKKKNKRKRNTVKRRVRGWTLNRDFSFLQPLRTLLLSSVSTNKKDIVTRLKHVGNVKLVILGGIFLNADEGRLDLLVVGDRLAKRSLENTLRSIESEIGKELTYAAMDTKEFQYRLGMYDKFVRDILDYPHETLLDRIGI